MFCIFYLLFLPTFSKIEYFSWSQKQKATTPLIKVERQSNKSETIPTTEPESGEFVLRRQRLTVVDCCLPDSGKGAALFLSATLMSRYDKLV